MVMVSTAPLLAALGEDIKITPQATAQVPAPEAQDVRAIVTIEPMMINQAQDIQVNRVSLDLPSSPAYRIGDAVIARGQSLLIWRILPGSDAGWTRYWCSAAGA